MYKAKPIPEYSTKYPEPNSASDSVTSKGIFFTSVNNINQNKKHIGNPGIINHTVISCIVIILYKLKLCANVQGYQKIKLNEIPYELVKAIVL